MAWHLLNRSGQHRRLKDLLPTILQLILFLLWFIAQVILLAWMCDAFGLCFSSERVHDPKHWIQPGAGDAVALITVLIFITAVPKLASFGISLIPERLLDTNLEYLMSRIRLSETPARLSQVAPTSLFADDAPSGPAPSVADPAALVLAARIAWKYEHERAYQTRKNIRQYTGIFGSAASLTLTACVALLVLTAHGSALTSKGIFAAWFAGSPLCLPGINVLSAAACDARRAVTLGAMIQACKTDPIAQFAAVIGIAALVSFLRSATVFVKRTALNDMSARAVASSTVELLDAMVAAAALWTFVRFQSIQPLAQDNPGSLIVVGLAAALFGDRVMDFIGDKLRQLLGLAKRIVDGSSADLNGIDGVSESDSHRLAEEGIYTVHHLAFFPTARLFHCTQYSLAAICDWQDQALLIAYVGKARAEVFRQALLVRGATDAQGLLVKRLREHGNASPTAGAASQPSASQKLASLLGFPDEQQARLALEDLATSTVVWRVAFYQSAVEPEVPEPEPDHTN